jgi:cell division protease FtsH
MLYTRDEIVARMVSLLGGRAAERVVYGHLSTGAANDLEVATRLARHMVTRYGMSDVIGPVSLEEESSNFLRDPFNKPTRSYGEETAQNVDAEVRELITRCEKRAVEIITAHKAQLERIRGVLMEKEVLDRDEFEKLMADALPAAIPPVVA